MWGDMAEQGRGFTHGRGVSPQQRRRGLACCGLLLAGILQAISAQAEEPRAEATFPVIWSIGEGIQAPESAYYDAASGHLFVSQVRGGGGLGKDGDGRISKLTVEGHVVADEWVGGLNAPKGLRSHQGTLWVADIDRIISIDIGQGKVLQTIEIPGAKFLNDLTCGPDGAVYVADMLSSRILRFFQRKISIFAEGNALESPNGLLVKNGQLIVAAWGLEIQDDFSTKVPGRLLSVDLSTGIPTHITAEPLGNLDGLEADGQGGFFVTDWVSGKLYHVDADGRAQVLMSFPKGAADIGFVAERKLLIVPEMLENRLTAFDVSSVLE